MVVRRTTKLDFTNILMLTLKLELHALQTQTILSHQRRLQSNIFNKDNIKYYGLNMSFYFG